MLKTEVDTALKALLDKVPLRNPLDNTMVMVPFSFQADKEMMDANNQSVRATYPCIAVSFVSLTPDPDRETHDWRGITTIDVPNQKAYRRPMERAYTLTYQINLFSKYIEHDSYLMREVLKRLPREGYLEIKLGDDATGYKQTVWCFLDDFRNLDNIKEMKLYHKAFTYNIMTGLDYVPDSEVPAVKTPQININITNTP